MPKSMPHTELESLGEIRCWESISLQKDTKMSKMQKCTKQQKRRESTEQNSIMRKSREEQVRRKTRGICEFPGETGSCQGTKPK